MTKRQAVLYRMALADQVEETGYEVDDRVLRTRGEVDAFERENEFETTPQIFIGGEHIGGSAELEAYLIKEQSTAG